MCIIESYWKKFKELHKLALDRFCQGVLADAQTITQHDALSAQARYGMLYRLMRNRDNDIVRTFDPYSRYSALMALRMMVMHDLLTDAELLVLSESAREEMLTWFANPMRLNGLMRSCGRTDNRYHPPSTREPGC